MELLPGFVSVPRPAGSPRPAGAFFSAVVEASAGPGAWKVRIDGRTLTVTSALPLAPGQTLRLQLVSQAGGAWLLKVLPEQPAAPGTGPETGGTGLLAAFLSRGLPAASEALSRWTAWVSGRSGPSDKEGWAASLEARNLAPGPATAALEPWLAWQAALEEGRSPPPPEDEGFWDLWNSRKTASGQAWLVVPLRWEYRGVRDAGLLQARWNPAAGTVDAWNLTAAPAGLGFRLEARPQAAGLEFTWRLFSEAHRRALEPLAPAWAQALSRPSCPVRLTVKGPAGGAGTPRGGLDVRA